MTVASPTSRPDRYAMSKLLNAPSVRGGTPQAATRGDGEVGEDVTHNALHGGIQGLPLRFTMPPGAATSAPTSAAPEWVEVRGEVYVRIADLQQVRGRRMGGAMASHGICHVQQVDACVRCWRACVG